MVTTRRGFFKKVPSLGGYVHSTWGDGVYPCWRRRKHIGVNGQLRPGDYLQSAGELPGG